MAHELKVTTRTVFGKKVRSLRAERRVPAELYGNGIENRHLSVHATEFEKLYRAAGEHTVVTLVVDEKEKVPALVVDVSRAPLSGSFLSVDFRQINMKETIDASVPIEILGKPAAAALGFPMLTVLHELPIRALPADLPHRIEVDVTALTNPGDTIHVSDLKLTHGVKSLASPDAVVVTIGSRTKEEVVAPPPAAAAPAAGTATADAAPATDEKTDAKK